MHTDTFSLSTDISWAFKLDDVIYNYAYLTIYMLVMCVNFIF